MGAILVIMFILFVALGVPISLCFGRGILYWYRFLGSDS